MVLESQLLPAPRFVFGRVKGGLTMTYPTLQAFPSGSEAANTLQSQAATDLAMALRVDERRCRVQWAQECSISAPLTHTCNPQLPHVQGGSDWPRGRLGDYQL